MRISSQYSDRFMQFILKQRIKQPFPLHPAHLIVLACI
ncbi:hypothetical protein CSB69_3344 [Morganella morganii]|nr:hypothetical protein CSB69_3344 [Morganella morganii]